MNPYCLYWIYIGGGEILLAAGVNTLSIIPGINFYQILWQRGGVEIATRAHQQGVANLPSIIIALLRGEGIEEEPRLQRARLQGLSPKHDG